MSQGQRALRRRLLGRRGSQRPARSPVRRLRSRPDGAPAGCGLVGGAGRSRGSRRGDPPLEPDGDRRCAGGASRITPFRVGPAGATRIRKSRRKGAPRRLGDRGGSERTKVDPSLELDPRPRRQRGSSNGDDDGDQGWRCPAQASRRPAARAGIALASAVMRSSAGRGAREMDGDSPRSDRLDSVRTARAPRGGQEARAQDFSFRPAQGCGRCGPPNRHRRRARETGADEEHQRRIASRACSTAVYRGGAAADRRTGLPA